MAAMQPVREVPVFTIDSFTSAPFSGNPCAVVSKHAYALGAERFTRGPQDTRGQTIGCAHTCIPTHVVHVATLHCACVAMALRDGHG
jgi:hypothetical protein